MVICNDIRNNKSTATICTNVLIVLYQPFGFSVLLVLAGFCNRAYPIQNAVKPKSVAEHTVGCYGWLEHLGNGERREKADHRVH